jgi:hypothetical protein
LSAPTVELPPRPPGAGPVSRVQCTVYGVRCTVYSVQCTVYSVQCTVYSVQFAVYSVQCTVYSVQCHCRLFSTLSGDEPFALRVASMSLICWFRIQKSRSQLQVESITCRHKVVRRVTSRHVTSRHNKSFYLTFLSSQSCSPKNRLLLLLHLLNLPHHLLCLSKLLH